MLKHVSFKLLVMEAIYQQVVESRDTSLLDDPPNNLLCASAELLRSSWQLQRLFPRLGCSFKIMAEDSNLFLTLGRQFAWINNYG